MMVGYVDVNHDVYNSLQRVSPFQEPRGISTNREYIWSTVTLF